MKEQKIIDPVHPELLLKELNEKTFLRKTRKGNNEIYVVNHTNSPNVLKEIGRLREVTFRASGGGTGKDFDLDYFDLDEKYFYDQLIVWSPEDLEIIGGYRYVKCAKSILPDQAPQLSTSHYFDFSERFTKKYLPKTIELGRSWVQPNFQPSVNPRKGLFALDNIWDGLGALIIENPEIEFFFGKVTMYPSYPRKCRDLLLNFMHHYFPDEDHLMEAKHPLTYGEEKDFLDQIKSLDFKDGFKLLNSLIREKGAFIPPLVNIYMNLSPSMKTFGTAVNPEFGGVEETGILVKIEDIYPDKKERHLKY